MNSSSPPSPSLSSALLLQQPRSPNYSPFEPPSSELYDDEPKSPDYSPWDPPTSPSSPTTLAATTSVASNKVVVATALDAEIEKFLDISRRLDTEYTVPATSSLIKFNRKNTVNRNGQLTLKKSREYVNRGARNERGQSIDNTRHVKRGRKSKSIDNSGTFKIPPNYDGDRVVSGTAVEFIGDKRIYGNEYRTLRTFVAKPNFRPTTYEENESFSLDPKTTIAHTKKTIKSAVDDANGSTTTMIYDDNDDDDSLKDSRLDNDLRLFDERGNLNVDKTVKMFKNLKPRETNRHLDRSIGDATSTLFWSFQKHGSKMDGAGCTGGMFVDNDNITSTPKRCNDEFSMKRREMIAPTPTDRLYVKFDLNFEHVASMCDSCFRKICICDVIEARGMN